MKAILKTKSLQIKAAKFNDVYYQACLQSRNFLRKAIGPRQPHLLLVLGSGLGRFANSPKLKNKIEIPYKDIPNYPVTGAPGHDGLLIFGDIGDKRVMIQRGRVHPYEALGWNMAPARALKLMTLPLVVAKGLGVKAIVTSHASGAVDNGYVKKGHVVAIVDHHNQLPFSPLVGPNDPRLGKRFPSKKQIYDQKLLELFAKCLPTDRFWHGEYTTAGQMPEYEGVGDLDSAPYHISSDPKFVYLWGMSYGPECEVINHYNDIPSDVNGFDRQVRHLGLSLATNIIPRSPIPSLRNLLKGKTVEGNPTSEEEVIQAGREAEPHFIPAIIKFISLLSK
ncbi:hypothetical protein A3C25_03090 [Candidatus Roizmanbacteria bacterium RIFCSPHIGHO2_02_FULL_38_11]|uniref:purine-nucleoside phosphorylase n=1 Tax=Candidatus Roizmanbacteria bacterium RIFCSPHIGHO2_02_FULL_38_11 TaxID=1802039 RepID=A0A1F7H0X8_9BACT|nr:MAG: hypothetical protein A3C25_03090 [Candidatus Roizmanbacteria bacterium RIFCSPHIGHO2_02_FULL_38_11]